MSSEYGDPTRMPTRLFKGIRGQTALGNSRPGPRLLPHTPGMTLPPSCVAPAQSSGSCKSGEGPQLHSDTSL